MQHRYTVIINKSHKIQEYDQDELPMHLSLLCVRHERAGARIPESILALALLEILYLINRAYIIRVPHGVLGRLFVTFETIHE